MNLSKSLAHRKASWKCAFVSDGMGQDNGEDEAEEETPDDGDEDLEEKAAHRLVEKFNPNHDANGRFATGPGHAAPDAGGSFGGSGVPQTTDTAELAKLQDAFTASPWAARTPVDVEVGFEMMIGDTVVRGRIDAVFADADGGVTVVDWKTGDPPADDEARRHAAVQLAVYRLAWAGLTSCPLSQVRAAFHYVRSGRTVRPEALPEADELAALLRPDALLSPAGESCV
jgi:ATP-dependent exoDNAse (exonuclease V) beta subunit